MSEATSQTVSNKTELIAYTTRAWNGFVAHTDGLTNDQWVTPVDPAGWSAKDHVAHVTVWDQAVIEQLRNKTSPQQTLRVPDDIWANGADAINEALRQRTIDDPVESVKARRDQVWIEFLATLSSMSEEDLAGPGNEFHLEQDGKPLLEVLVGWQGGHYDHHGEYIAAIVEQ